MALNVFVDKRSDVSGCVEAPRDVIAMRTRLRVASRSTCDSAAG